jgi:hypothetical protein
MLTKESDLIIYFGRYLFLFHMCRMNTFGMRILMIPF